MAIESKTRANGTTIYRVAYRNPLTGKRERTSYVEDKNDALIENAKIKKRIKKDPQSFSNSGCGDSKTFAGIAARYIAEHSMAASTRDVALYNLREHIMPHLGAMYPEDITKAVLKDMERVWREETARKDAERETARQKRDNSRRLENIERAKLGKGPRKIQAKDRPVKSSGLSQGTANRRMSYIKSILSWAEEEGIIEEMPRAVEKYKCPRGQHEKLLPPSPSEVDAIWNVAPERVRRMIVLCGCLGVRAGESEALRLRWCDVRWKEYQLVVWAAKKNKEEPWRIIDVPSPHMAIFARWHEADKIEGVETIIHYKGRPVKRLHRTWRTTLEKAGIERRLRPYDLRHYFATQALAGGADTKAVAEVMGHASTEMIHKHYQHVLNRQRKGVTGSVPVPRGVKENGGTIGGTNDDFQGDFVPPVGVIIKQ